MINQFHLIKNCQNSNIAFHYKSNTIIELNDFVFNILLKLQNNETTHSISQNTGINEV